MLDGGRWTEDGQQHPVAVADPPCLCAQRDDGGPLGLSCRLGSQSTLVQRSSTIALPLQVDLWKPCLRADDPKWCNVQNSFWIEFELTMVVRGRAPLVYRDNLTNWLGDTGGREFWFEYKKA